MTLPRAIGRFFAALPLGLAVAVVGLSPAHGQNFTFYGSSTTVGSSSLTISVNGGFSGNTGFGSGNFIQGSGNLILEAGGLSGNPSGGDLILHGINDSTGNLVVLNGNLNGIQVGSGNLSFSSVTFNLTNSTLMIGNVNFNGSNNITSLTVGNGSVFNLSSNTVVNGALNITNNGTLAGSGNLTGNATVNGTLLPGGSGSVGLLSFSSDVNLGANATTSLQLGGNLRGTQYSALNVGGNLSLGGTLAVSLLNNFIPAVGATFNFFQAGSIAGDFAAIVLPALNGNLTWDSSQLAVTGDLSTNSINFTQWTNEAGLSGNNALPTAKPFSGGPANLIRYAMNLGTAVAPANVPQPMFTTISGTPCLTLQYRVRKNMTDYQLVPQYSIDLMNWSNVAADNIAQLPDDDTYTARYQAAVALPASGTIFLRVVAQ
jgi:hypothetical protein